MTNNKNFVAGIAVEKAATSFDKIFDYKVPETLIDKNIQPGCRVLVPFGRAGKKRQGIVVYLKEDNNKDLKEISKLLDESPVVTKEMLETAEFMKNHYFCTFYDAVKAMLPAGINYKITNLYSAVKDNKIPLTIYEQQLYDYLLKSKQQIKEDKIYELFDFADEELLKDLTSKGVIRKSEQAFRKVGDAAMKMAALNEELDFSNVKLTPKQQNVIDILQTAGSVSVKEICYYTGITSAVIDALVKKNYVFYYEDEVFRTPKAEITEAPRPLSLTDEQNIAFEEIYGRFKENKPSVSLLYGVTGSGKTSVFLKLIEKVLEEDKGIIVMVPEISLTPQFINIFSGRFGKKVAVFHSGLSFGERLDEYKRVKNGDAKIAIGTRSAVFAPFENIGLIIMDEEQESTYKSESTPRYHAREVAKFRITKHNALLLLSSATPSVESYYNALTERYGLSVLNNRYGGAVLPKVVITDMNLEAQEGNLTGFSSVLLENLKYNLEHNKQSILLLNRRGHNVYVSCPHCQEAVSCPNCSITMTYHSANHRLMCHYCGYSIPFANECPNCHEKGLKMSGAGTQKAEEELEKLLPDARVLRLDTDSTMKKFSHQRKLSAFANGDYDILIGTQMVAKGLDFPNVTLVGVLNADQMLYADDYRSYERTFSLLTQVVGRSGRGKDKGLAVIQTYTPENNIISLAANQDYKKFYNGEISIRKAMLYPPFADICMVGFVGNNQVKTLKASKAFLDFLISIAKSNYNDIPLRILGPSPANILMVSNKFRYKLIIKCRNNSTFRSMLNTALVEFEKNRDFKDVTVYADMNTLSF
ncbi:MAG: primosomal protein N' [Ruminococcus sp.]|nr:primosomal protein N' [Ruminococcus sp.]